MMHPNTELLHVSNHVGYGVFATAFIPKGSIVWVADLLDQRFTEEQLQAFPSFYQPIIRKYSYRDRNGLWILCWDHARFVNHSCDANCLSTGFDFEIAVRDIRQGEELCDDYGMLNLPRTLSCMCGSPACRKTVRSTDMEVLAAKWDNLSRSALALINSVPQPLWHLIDNSDAVQATVENPTSAPSVRNHYLPPPSHE